MAGEPPSRCEWHEGEGYRHSAACLAARAKRDAKVRGPVKVSVEEEYGYRLWTWDYPGTVEELVADWKAGVAPLNFFDPSMSDFKGTLVLVRGRRRVGTNPDGSGIFTERYDLPQPELDAWYANPLCIHTHMPDDSYLRVPGATYPHPRCHEEAVLAPAEALK